MFKQLTNYKAGGQAAAHAGRQTVMVRDFDFIRNLSLTIESGSSGTGGFTTPAATKEKVEKLAKSVAGRKRKRGGIERLEGGEEEG
jgi:hypothetical protein